MACAEQEARTLRHRHIGTEHLLLGVLSVTEETGARALAALGVTLGDARAQVMRIVGLPEQPSPPQLPMTPQARDALGGALREAIELGDTTVGTGHVLLALLRERHGVAARLMHDAGIDRALLRKEVRTAGAQPTAPADPSGETDGGATPGDDRGVGA